MSEPAAESSTLPVAGMKCVPEFFGTDSWIVLGGMWAALCHTLISDDGAVAAFEKDTGLKLSSLAKRTALDAMIDSASGYEAGLMAAWCDWVTKNVWGEQKPERDGG